MIWISCDWKFQVSEKGSGSIKLGGLPFACDENSRFGTYGICFGSALTTTPAPFFFLAPGEKQLDIMSQTGSNAAINNADQYLTIALQMWYRKT